MCCSFHASNIEEERGTGRHRLHKYWCGPADERRDAEQLTGPYIPNRDLTPVAGMHIDAKQTLYNDGESFVVGFGVDDMPTREFDDPPSRGQRFDCSDRD
jgi:hypothetical protein